MGSAVSNLSPAAFAGYQHLHGARSREISASAGYACLIGAVLCPEHRKFYRHKPGFPTFYIPALRHAYTQDRIPWVMMDRSDVMQGEDWNRIRKDD